MKKFTITVKKWLRGGKVWSKLRNEAGNMCCLGHLAKACGAKNEEIFGQIDPYDVPLVKFPKGIFSKYKENSEITEQIISVNDMPGLTLENRKAELTRLFAKINLKPVFK